MDAINRRRWLKQGIAAGVGGLALTRVPEAPASANVAITRGIAGVFGIQVLDAATGRGVPLVELRTVNDVRYYTDSAGYAAIDDPGLLNRQVYFFNFQSRLSVAERRVWLSRDSSGGKKRCHCNN